MKKLVALFIFLLAALAHADQVPVTVTGYEFWSDEARANRLAMQSYLEACKSLRDRVHALAGEHLSQVSCGTPIPIVGDDDVVSYSSIGTLSFRGEPALVMNIGAIEGDELQWTDASSDEAETIRKKARQSYDAHCLEWVSEMKDRFGEKLLYADCGDRENTPTQAVPEDTLAWKYVSHGRVTLAPTEEAPKPEAPVGKPILVEKADPAALIKTRDELRERLRVLQEKLKAVPKAAEPAPQPSAPASEPRSPSAS